MYGGKKGLGFGFHAASIWVHVICVIVFSSTRLWLYGTWTRKDVTYLKIHGQLQGEGS